MGGVGPGLAGVTAYPLLTGPAIVMFLVVTLGYTALVMLTRIADKCALLWLSLRAHQLVLVVTALLFFRLL